MKKIIAVLPLYDPDKQSYWMLPGYFKGIEAAGGLPVMLPLTSDKAMLQQMINTFDGFLFTGGQDITPSLYNELPNELCGKPVFLRDVMEKELFNLVLKHDKPALGICRGCQLFNVLSGGTLYQDLPSQNPSKIIHHQTPPYDQPIHHVYLINDTPLQRLLQTDSLNVNSYHHQGIKQLGHNLKVMAKSKDKLIEAICRTDKKFIWGVQWHPEFSYLKDSNSLKIFEAFIKTC